jgi:hypothetical protein
MDSGCCLCCFNCCFFNCFDSFWLSIIQFITSIIGIVANSYILSISKKIFDSSKFLFSTQVVNISFFSGGTGLSTILLFLKKFDKINQGCFYNFSWLSSKIYSICSKVMMIINIFGFFYMIGFTHFLTMDVGEDGGKQLFNYSLYDYVGPGRYDINNNHLQQKSWNKNYDQFGSFSKRFEYNDNESIPGPGDYNIRQPFLNEKKLFKLKNLIKLLII